MKKIIFTISVMMLITGSQLVAGMHSLQEHIRNYIENKPENIRYSIDNDLLFSSQVLPRFYTNRVFEPAWINNSRPNNQAADMVAAIEGSATHGLVPADYHLDLIREYHALVISNETPDLNDQLKLEILLTDAFMLLGSHFYFGKVDPEKVNAEWKIQRKEPGLRLDLRLQRAIENNDIKGEFAELTPKIKGYGVLRNHLAMYRGLAEVEWPPIPFTTVLKPGAEDARLPDIRAKLHKLGYNMENRESEVYDSVLVSIVELFQRHHGLNTDGVIGRRTLEAINLSPRQRVNTIRLNMERLRWLPLEIPDRYILVNIANAELHLLEGADTIIQMRAIVGRNYRKTPVFSGRMTYLVFSPTWTVPPGILRNDVIPELKKGPEYLTQKNMRILRFDGTEVAYETIDWQSVDARNFPFMVRQNPGPDNALGAVKFMFPNQYNVYIHDTPTRGLFAQESRALSSGCIRIERPFDLAKILLAENQAWTDERILTAMNNTREQTVTLPRPIPVVMVYFTAWSNAINRINFREDVYKRDAEVLKALDAKPLEYVLN